MTLLDLAFMHLTQYSEYVVYFMRYYLGMIQEVIIL